MEKTNKMPIWVFLAFSAIETRRGALILILSSILFSVYSIPWSNLFTGVPWISSVFLIDNWSWVAMMFPITFWYWLSLKWVDKNSMWAK
ncbi:MAG: hypothetical protein BMS9Abin06_0170 [Gammaproteobacteria bacterium]|nr:MAG: hypothetical protein BMS9Abin06_0170 [Gammaproteobacteria bacterium]